MKIRELNKSDIVEIFIVRISTLDNSFSLNDLAAIGKAKQSVSDWLDGSIQGWVCELSGKIVGFALGDRKTTEILVIAIYPEYEKLGIGRKLMSHIQNWLWSFGHSNLWLWSNFDKSVRAHGFYRKLGRVPTGETHNRNEKLILTKIKESLTEH